ncbi:DNA polymerase epsilon subunit C [Zancudomyces culisetae]|uniref:DNA polymerase epsilon subunit C n=1 Tax=Zancudomyces culisetae TaxID=1213189 RepID=A0A1R1PX00_ZANCU|nr:DNA polymerase epsilon subunit C [Zancudomyces culisetae]|eukprot:OMH85510.1 DNA polymerase epsilon subunit C [Zancudomyces culisetae]
MKKKYKTKFPVARIKRIMQMDEDVGKMSQATPVLISKALEMFMQNIINDVAQEARKANLKRILPAHFDTSGARNSLGSEVGHGSEWQVQDMGVKSEEKKIKQEVTDGQRLPHKNSKSRKKSDNNGSREENEDMAAGTDGSTLGGNEAVQLPSLGNYGNQLHSYGYPGQMQSQQNANSGLGLNSNSVQHGVNLQQFSLPPLSMVSNSSSATMPAIQTISMANQQYNQPYAQQYGQPYNQAYGQQYSQSYTQPYNQEYSQEHNRRSSRLQHQQAYMVPGGINAITDPNSYTSANSNHLGNPEEGHIQSFGKNDNNVCTSGNGSSNTLPSINQGFLLNANNCDNNSSNNSSTNQYLSQQQLQPQPQQQPQHQQSYMGYQYRQ